MVEIDATSTAAFVGFLAASLSKTEALDLVELAETTAQGETQELVEEPPENFLDKPLDSYSTTEGLLLVIVVLLVISFLGGFLRRCMSWL